jgi:phosphatidate cytidylyltransferase
MIRVLAGLALSATLMISVVLYRSQYIDDRILLINLPLISFIFLTVLFLKSEAPFSELAFIFLGQFYVTLPFILLYCLAFALDQNIYNKELLLGYFFLLWANDTGAYISGSLFGKHPLTPVISPKKTWEGSAGGAFLVIALVFVNYYLFRDLALTGWAVSGFMVLVMGTLGDLVKSVMKRSKGVKDSGTILPGHGGILDRFDSLIGSIPFVYIYVLLLG